MLKVYLIACCILLQLLFPSEAYGKSNNESALKTDFGNDSPVCSPTGQKISGFIDGVQNNHLTGWACEHGEKIPVKIRIFVSKSEKKEKGLLVKETVANLKSEPALTPWCKISGGAHRFAIPLGDWAHLHRGKPIYVFGISNVGICGKQQLFGHGASIPKIP
ncbi:MAG: hypothetical protein EB078_04430 [Proteobacteria bacterium]|nr:hypothetical protein [Pseudomonadota bacterium]NDC25024.1 hypothetical protein [Pseudomonadota bacterium]NDD04130.1 hypothetical protein [Pseudomonadota bacterium]NDG25860.1 hypothetical protein [Pseudomonadota bacterium]